MLKQYWKTTCKMIGLVKPLTLYMIVAILMGIAGFLCSTFIPVFGAMGILNIIGMDTVLPLQQIFIAILAFAVLRGILRYAEQASNHYIAFRLLALIRDKLFRALRKLCPAKLEGRDRGNLIALLTADVELLEVFYAHTISPTAIAIGMSLIMSIFIGSYHFVLGFYALFAYLVLGAFVPAYVATRGKDVARQFRDASGELGSHVLDSLRGLEESLQYKMGESRLKEMKEKSDHLASLEKKLKEGIGHNQAVTNTIVLALSVVFLWIAMHFVSYGSLDFGGILIPFVAFVSSFGPVLALANLGSTLQPTFAAASRVFEILEEKPMVEEVKNGNRPEFTGANVSNVNFTYETNGDNVEILKDFTLPIEKNKMIGLVGKSGSGKSTLLKLLMRFWDCNEGEIALSDVSIKEWDTDWLRQQESYMTQDTHLFQDTIENNIKLAKWNATREEIIEACKKASIHEFILSLPNGYETQVGELGDTLSGGERQRIGLARAFLHDAPFLLLDEPTSNLDSLNEAVILKSLVEQKAEKTVILVSHRESTIRMADEVYHVHNGRRSS